MDPVCHGLALQSRDSRTVRSVGGTLSTDITTTEIICITAYYSLTSIAGFANYWAQKTEFLNTYSVLILFSL